MITKAKNNTRGLQSLLMYIMQYIIINAGVALVGYGSFALGDLGLIGSYFATVLRMFAPIIYFTWLPGKEQVAPKNTVQENGDHGRLIRQALFVLAPTEAVFILFFATHWTDLVMTAAEASQQGIVQQFVWSIPKILFIDAMYDFFYYWAHRYSHHNKFLYHHAHQDHHSQIHPGPLSNFDTPVLDGLVSVSIPMMLTFSIFCYILGVQVTVWQLHLFQAYRYFGEASNHAGWVGEHLNVPQIPKGISKTFDEVVVGSMQDHYLHHTKVRGNYSKRYRLWDIMFGTRIPVSNAATAPVSTAAPPVSTAAPVSIASILPAKKQVSAMKKKARQKQQS